MAQSIRESLFRELDVVREQAQTAKADILSPKKFAAGERAYGKAEDDINEGRADRARTSVEKATVAFRDALETTELAAVSFASTLEARDRAIAANAARLEPELWEDAEDKLNKAALKLESGTVDSARRPAKEAETLFEQAELAAIKTAIVGEARQLIAAADSAKIDKFAPATLDKSRQLVATAEALLDEDRYSTARPRVLAADAEYEARHASYIASQAEAVKDKALSVEALILNWETPLRELLSSLGGSTDMTAGPDGPAAAAVKRATELKELNTDMATRLVLLEEELGTSSQIAREAELLQQQLREIESLFQPGQAIVVRQGTDLILRLVGLSFPVGQATIQTDYYGILRQVQEALKVYPDSTVVIEGHTDSQGSPATNMALSQQRADAVREYLLANSTNVSPSAVRAMGYGSERPIASEATAEGRAQNRRIDVVIRDARAREL
ncbi:MAG: OmpA family protein [Gammaproteobacteria bacterium]|jgi:outer membrane protein OmpA-like peptidoglycan-associated protein|nr:OmpA family protein [Gammaproteobacteria bacterium]